MQCILQIWAEKGLKTLIKSPLAKGFEGVEFGWVKVF